MKKVTFTPEQVKELEKKNKCDLIHIMVFLDNDRDKDPDKRQRVDCLLKDPLSLSNLKMMSALISIDDRIDQGEWMLDNLWIDGDDAFKANKETLECNNTRVRYVALNQALKHIPILDAAVAKH